MFTAMVLWTAFGSVFALLLGYSRIPYAAAQDGYFFKFFGRLHPKVCVELLTDARLYSLPRREADMVFRITRFREAEVISRRLLRIPYALYAVKGSKPPPRGDGSGVRITTMSREAVVICTCGVANQRCQASSAFARRLAATSAVTGGFMDRARQGRSALVRADAASSLQRQGAH